MSLEAKIEALTVAVAALTQAMCQGAPAPVAVAPAAVQPAPAVAQIATPVAAAPVAAAPAVAMPPLPTFIPPAAPPVVAAVASAPFSDLKGLIAYTMEAYKGLGPQKGALIQNVLKECGTSNINEIVPDKFAQFYAGVEALKAS